MELIPGLPRPPAASRLVAALTTTVVGGLSLLAVAAVAAGTGFPTAAIADYALSAYPPGSSEGQCIIFAERVVDATYAEYGVSHGFEGAATHGYYAVYAAAGARLVGLGGAGDSGAALDAAQRGDVIQLSPLSPSSSSDPWSGQDGGHQHTAILLGQYGSGTQVIDSNWDLDGLVRIHPLTDVLAWARRWGLELAVWGFGLASGS